MYVYMHLCIYIHIHMNIPYISTHVYMCFLTGAALADETLHLGAHEDSGPAIDGGKPYF